MKNFVCIFLLSMMTGVLLGAGQKNDVLLLIDGQPVTVSEYEAYCRLSQVSGNLTTVALEDFINFKLKVVEASEAGCDTLLSFRRMLEALSTEVKRKENRLNWNGINVQRGEWVKVEMLTFPVRQDASNALLERKRNELQAVYSELQANRQLHLSEMASDGQYCSGEQWIPVGWFLPEVEEAIRRTNVGDYSEVFVSSVGVNLLRVVDRTDDHLRTIESAWTTALPFQERALKDILLVMYWDNLLAKRVNREDIDEKELTDFFRKNRRNYTFDLPHYRGVVVHCADKASLKTIKRKLRKVPLEEWPEQIECLVRQHSISNAKSEYGLFRIGANDVVDCMVFKCIELPEDKDYPYVQVKGKILKKGPECLDDVRDKVIRDYMSEETDMKFCNLRSRHEVKILCSLNREAAE